jgi:hypothetical protein
VTTTTETKTTDRAALFRARDAAIAQATKNRDQANANLIDTRKRVLPKINALRAEISEAEQQAVNAQAALDAAATCTEQEIISALTAEEKAGIDDFYHDVGATLDRLRAVGTAEEKYDLRARDLMAVQTTARELPMHVNPLAEIARLRREKRIRARATVLGGSDL